MAKILDLADESSVYSTRLLAECGHDVIRIEPRSGDPVRRLGPFLGNIVDLEHGAYHQFFNTGKRSFSADLRSEPGRDLFIDLLPSADAVILGGESLLEVEDVAASNPKAVVALVERSESSDLLAAASSGLLSLVGDPQGEPIVLGGQVLHSVIGLYTAIATAAACHLAQHTGKGQTIRISAQGALEAMMEQSALTYVTEGRVIRRRGYRGEITAASSAFAAADGFWMLSVLSAGKAWRDFVEWVQDPVLLADESLADEAQRRAKQRLIAERLDAWSLRHPKAELIAQAQRLRIPSSPVTNALDVAGDEQLIARGYLVDEEREGLGRHRVPRGAIATPRGATLRPAPKLGQHNAEILAGLGYTPDEHAALLGAGAL